jgi:hypothetical protein
MTRQRAKRAADGRVRWAREQPRRSARPPKPVTAVGQSGDDRQWRIGAMDGETFDQIARTMGAAQTRRAALRTAAALGAAVLGGRSLAAGAQTVEPAGHKCQGKSCNKNKNCGHGLKCSKKGKCEYKHGNKGGKNDTCCHNNDCKGKFKCKHNKCKKK